MDYYAGHRRNASLTCRYFGISRQTFYRWRRRYDPRQLVTLADRGHRPRRVRQPTWSLALLQAVQALREERPRWGKDKLAPLLWAQGWTVSVSMVGRILAHLHHTGQLREPACHAVSAHKRRLLRPYAVRKPKEYSPTLPGDLVQVDTVDLRPLPGVILKQFTAIDVVSRWSVVAVRTRATATTATQFLDDLSARYPYALHALQVDGGSEFMADFEAACQQRGLRLFVLPPRSPKLNGCVERANRTCLPAGRPMPKSSGNAMTGIWTSPPSSPRSVPGSRSTTPSGHTRPWAIAPPNSFWHNGSNKERSKVSRIT